MSNITKEKNEEYAKDQAVLEKVRELVSDDVFENIEYELTESENPSNYRIVDEPVGDFQDTTPLKVWVDQNTGGGYSGDSWYGTVCVELPNGKYLMWDYWM